MTMDDTDEFQRLQEQFQLDLATARIEREAALQRWATTRRDYRRMRRLLLAANLGCCAMNYWLLNYWTMAVSVAGAAYCAFGWKDLPEDPQDLLGRPPHWIVSMLRSCPRYVDKLKFWTKK